MRSLFTLFIVLCCLTGFSQTYSEKDFVLSPLPKVGSEEWYKLNDPAEWFAVAVVDGRLQITKYQESDYKEIAIPAGKIKTFDFGEWGGGLYFKPADTLKKVFNVNGELVYVSNKLENYRLVLGKKSTPAFIKGGHV